MFPGNLVSNLILACIFLGVGSLLIFVYMSKRRPDIQDKSSIGVDSLDDTGAELSSEGQRVRRRRVFLHLYPEWENRDFEGDPQSPWHTDLRFRTLHNDEGLKRMRIPDIGEESPEEAGVVAMDGFPVHRHSEYPFPADED